MLIFNSFTVANDYNFGVQRHLFSYCREISSKGVVTSFCIKNHSVKRLLNLVLSLFMNKSAKKSNARLKLNLHL